jgi:hypothetical protein
MDSERLRARLKQPGHDRTFKVSEEKFLRVALDCLDFERYELISEPKELREIFKRIEGGRDYGIEPEAVVISRETGRRFFVEVKKQALGGNADERACKHHTVQFYKTLQTVYGYDFHPYVTILCEDLATYVKYVTKAPYFFEADQYLLWVDYDPALLCRFLNERCRAWLDD